MLFTRVVQVIIQHLSHIGDHFKTDAGKVLLSNDSWEDLIQAVVALKSEGMYHPAKSYMMILGLMVATISSMEFAHFQMRPLQLHLRKM